MATDRVGWWLEDVKPGDFEKSATPENTLGILIRAKDEVSRQMEATHALLARAWAKLMDIAKEKEDSDRWKEWLENVEAGGLR